MITRVVRVIQEQATMEGSTTSYRRPILSAGRTEMQLNKGNVQQKLDVRSDKRKSIT